MLSHPLKGKKILLCISASIAAYKSILLLRLLKKAGAEVKVILTPAAKDFVSPLVLATLAENPAMSEFTTDSEGGWNNHVALGLWADLLLLAPASANTLAKMAGGHCDNLLMATYLSARCPVMFAPAMDLDMFAHPATTANIDRLRSWGHLLIAPTSGELASGLEGKGRMAEPADICEAIAGFFAQNEPTSAILSGKKVLLTAGPTVEPIDPVRFISNHSTGKMGYALASVFLQAGAKVVLVSGPTQQSLPAHKNLQLILVQTAAEMYRACSENFSTADVAVFAAAVADYTPAEPAKQKIKKSGETLDIKMKKTHDIAAEMGRLKRVGQLTVGFALETENEHIHARKKLAAKNLDLIVLNSLRSQGAGFGHDTNQVVLIDELGEKAFPLKSKQEVALDIVEEIATRLNKNIKPIAQ